MKVNKLDLRKTIETIIGEGVVNCEEIDATTDNMMIKIWPVIDHLQTVEPETFRSQIDCIINLSELNDEEKIKRIKEVME